MERISIKVECHAGHKADERPRRLHWAGRWMDVVDVLDRWYEAGRDPEWPTADYFRVAADDGLEYLLRHDRQSDEWTMVF